MINLFKDKYNFISDVNFSIYILCVDRMRKNRSHQRHHSPARPAVLSVEVSLDFLDFLLDIGRPNLPRALQKVGSVFVSDLGLCWLVQGRQDSGPAAAGSFLSTPQLLLLPNQGEEVSPNAVSCFWL